MVSGTKGHHLIVYRAVVVFVNCSCLLWSSGGHLEEEDLQVLNYPPQDPIVGPHLEDPPLRLVGLVE